MSRRLPSSLYVIATAALLASACATPADTVRPSLPIPASRPDTAEALGSLPAGPLVIVARAGGLQTLWEELTTQLGLPGPGDLLPIEAEEADAGGAQEILGMLAKERPLIFALHDPPNARLLGQTVYGVLPDTEEAPPWLRATLVLPSDDPQRLDQALQRWLGEAGLQTLADVGLPVEEVLPASLKAPNTAVYCSPEVALALLRRPDAVEIRLLFLEEFTALASAFKELGEMGAGEGEGARVATPALNHLLSTEAPLAIYLDRSRLPALNAGVGLQNARTIGREAPPSLAVSFRATLLRSVMSSAVVMAPSERLVHDTTWTLELTAAGQLEVRGVDTLTERGARAMAAARADAAPVLEPIEPAPAVLLQHHVSLRRLLEVTGRPVQSASAADPQVLEGMLQESLPLTAYALSGSWLRLLVIGDASPGLDALDSLTAVVDVPRSAEQAVPFAALGTTRTPVKELRLLNMALNALLGVTGTIVPDAAGAGQVALTSGLDPATLLHLDAPSLPAFDTRFALNIPRLFQLLGEEDEESKAFAARLGAMEGRTFSGDHTLTSAIRLSMGVSGSPELTPGLIGGAAAPPTLEAEPWRCLEAIAHQRALALAEAGERFDDPEAVTNALDAEGGEVQRLLECARRDPGAGAVADEALAWWRLSNARFAEMRGDEGGTLKEASAACEGGVKAACTLVASLMPAWPRDSMTLARAAWRLPPTRLNALDRLLVGITRESMWIGAERLALPVTRAQITTALRAGMEHKGPNMRLGVALHAEAPWSVLQPVLEAANMEGVPLELLVEDRDGQRSLLAVTLPMTRPTAQRGGTRRVWVDIGPTQARLRWYTGGVLRSATAELARDPGLNTLRALRGVDPAAPALVLNISVAPDLPWQTVAHVIAGLRADRSRAVDALDALQQSQDGSPLPSLVLLPAPEEPAP